MPFPRGNVVRLTTPMAALVLHFDSNPHSVCEAMGLTRPRADLAQKLGEGSNRCAPLAMAAWLASMTTLLPLCGSLTCAMQ